MLNTDLNNPAISPKISLPEYVASCHRCTPLRDVPEPYLRQVLPFPSSPPTHLPTRTR